MINSINHFVGKTYMSIEKVERQVSTNKSNGSTTSKTATVGASFSDILNQAQKTSYDVGDLEEYFEKAASTYGISLDLLKAVAKAESDFDNNCVSSSGASGIMQLMPDTAEELGVTNVFDPEQNIMGGAKYLSNKLKEYDGDVSLALAAYNAGSGNVNKYGGIPPFTETQNYVKKILGYLDEA